MKKQIQIIITILFLSYNFGFSQSRCDWSTLDDANKNYETGNFPEVKTLLEACIKSGFDQNQKLQAYKLLAKTNLALDNDTAALVAIKEILNLNPKFQPDYLTDPLRFIEVLEDLKKKNNVLIVTSVSKKEENVNEAPATATVLSSKQLMERGYIDLEEMLHDLPGFDISRSNGNLYTHIYQRGYRSINTNRTLFLVDGIEENDLWSSNVYWSRQYAMTNVKSVEVIYGPASTMYGSNAFLGVVNIVTKEPLDFIKPTKRIGVNAKMGYGSYNTRFFDGTFAAKNKNNNISFSVTGRMFYSDEQDLSKYADHDYKPIELTDDLAKKYHSKLDIKNDSLVNIFLAKYPGESNLYTLDADNKIILTDQGVAQALEYDNAVYDKVSYTDNTEARSVDFKLKIYDFLIGATTWNKAEGPGAQYNDKIYMTFDQGQAWRPRHSYFYVKYDKAISTKLNITNFLRYKIHDFDNDNCIVKYSKNYASGNFKLGDLVDEKIPTWGKTYLFQKSNQIRNEFKVNYNITNKIDLLAGFEARYSSIQGDYTISTTNDAEETGFAGSDIPGGNNFYSRDLGLYAQSGIGIVKNLKATLGLRYDNNLIRTSEGYGHVFNPRLALVYTPDGFVFKGIYAEAFKDATNREKYSTAPGKRELSNPDLQPEKVKNFEFSAGKTIGKNTFVNIAAYRSEYSNIIQEVKTLKEDGTSTNQNQAKGQAEIFGINGFADWHIEDFSIYANYTYTNPYTLNPTDSEGKPVTDSLGVPYKKLRISDISNHKINIGGNYTFRKYLNFNLRMNFIGERITGENTTVPTNTDTFSPVAIFNGAVSFTPKDKGLTLQLSIFNIFNTEYFSPGLDQASGDLSSSLAQNGRNLHISLIYEF